jgi:hypothetical protein
MNTSVLTDDLIEQALAMLTNEQRRKGSYTTPEAVLILDQLGAPYAEATLHKLRSVGGGPPFWKVNSSIRYPRDELVRWAIKRRGPLMASTSEYRK